jgi:hypothetical protein
VSPETTADLAEARRHRLGRPRRLVVDDAWREGRPAGRGPRPVPRRTAAARRCREAALRGSSGPRMGRTPT